MSKTMKICILGGDNRIVFLAKILVEEGYYVNTYGVEIDSSENLCVCSSLKDAIIKSDIIITPLPFTRDNVVINSSLSQPKIWIKDIFEIASNNQIVLAGYLNTQIYDLAAKYSIQIFDYFEREELVVSNCIPTAEGAIKIAIEELTGTLHGSNCLVMGFGRIGKILSHMLNGIGSNVFVEARKAEDLAWINSYAYKSIELCNLESYIGDFDVVFNTIPHVILDEKLLKLMKKDSLIVDLASSPGGVDYEAAEKLNIKTKLALGLPGIVAPLASAKYIRDAVFNILKERGFKIDD